MMRIQATMEYVLFVSLVVALALITANGVLSLLKGVKDAASVIDKFTRQTGVSLNGLG